MEVHETSAAGKIFTIFVMIAGVGYFLYITGIIIQAVVEGEVQTLLGRKRLDKRISKLKNHYIVCGYGRIGRVLCRLIKEETDDVVVMEKDDNLIAILEKDKLHYIHGDVSDETLLEKAGIKKASFLIAALGTDIANVALKDSKIRQDFNLIIVAIKKASGEMLFNPHFETLIEPKDTVIVMGKTPDLKKFDKAVNKEDNF